MSAESNLIFTGILIVLTPFLGLPSVWYGYIFAVLGLVVLGIGLLFRVRRIANIRDSEASASKKVDQTNSNEPPHEPSPTA